MRILKATDSSIMFSILHLSDLHRSEAEPLTNDTLIASLLADRDRYPIETPEIRQPDAMIISGDIVSGAQIGQPNYGKELKDQYAIAYDFLTRLTDQLFGGDRECVVLLPGNHDCCWNTAFSGMTPVAKDLVPADLIGQLEAPNSSLRWSWHEQQLYNISNPDVYARRLDSYWDFVETFYSGFSLRFPIRRDAGYNLFELDGGRILVAAFESLHTNDCFSYQASFDPKAVANAALQVRDEGRCYNLRVATWHHALHSEPSYRSDYLPISSVYEMIGHGFQLGLHGHQHFAEIGSHYVHVPGVQAMAVVSAGSLCAGARDLPRGVNRQYNVIVISDDYSSAGVHVREMTRGNHFAPSTASGFPGGLIQMRISSTATTSRAANSFDHARRRRLIIQAEEHLRTGRPEEAFSILSDIDCKDEPYGRKLLIQAAEQSERWDRLTSILSDPQTGDERIQLIEALIQVDRIEDALAHLRAPDGPLLAEHVRRELTERLQRRTVMRGRAK